MIQLILLSGGSGKRLWPLSNDARSKQFLKLLKAPDGTMESMVQRVIRQVREAGLDCEITLATNASQRDIIINQLGDGIGIVTEPERRDTFPAIALSTAWLALEKHCTRDDVVVVMPSDPYTENSYFLAIKEMERLVLADVADLVLMGVKPSCPSSKFGYIVPEEDKYASKKWFKVARFTEKPDRAAAESLLTQGAFWNGGVFAFRLGYLLDIVGRYIRTSRFEDLSAHYGDLPKKSFDYEVVEKAKSVAVVPFTGSWKDLGTWDSLSEELSSPIIGNAYLGKDASDTYIINELQIPIFCDGIKDAIVAASPDGILVTSKTASENLKNYVPQFADRPLYEERRWGKYCVMARASYADGYKYLTKTLLLYPGKNISYQVHGHRDEVWTFVDGEGLLVLDGVVRKVSRGDVVHIAKGHKHALRAITELQLVEVQTGDLLEETDITRFPWEW